MAVCVCACVCQPLPHAHTGALLSGCSALVLLCWGLGAGAGGWGLAEASRWGSLPSQPPATITRCCPWCHPQTRGQTTLGWVQALPQLCSSSRPPLRHRQGREPRTHVGGMGCCVGWDSAGHQLQDPNPQALGISPVTGSSVVTNSKLFLTPSRVRDVSEMQNSYQQAGGCKKPRCRGFRGFCSAFSAFLARDTWAQAAACAGGAAAGALHGLGRAHCTAGVRVVCLPLLWQEGFLGQVAKTEPLGVIVQDPHKEEAENHRSRETKPGFQIGRSCLDKAEEFQLMPGSAW